MSNEIQIHSLDNATAFFINNYYDKNPLSNIKHDVSVKAKYESLDRKFYEDSYDVGDEGNPYPMPIKKQVEFTKSSDRPVARVISVKVFNALGMEDRYYYYVMARIRGWYRGWAKTFDFKKYIGSDGVYIPATVIEHIWKNKVIDRSSIAIVTGDGQIWIAKSKAIDDFYLKHHKVFVNSYSQIMIGFPKSLFERF